MGSHTKAVPSPSPPCGSSVPPTPIPLFTAARLLGAAKRGRTQNLYALDGVLISTTTSDVSIGSE